MNRKVSEFVRVALEGATIDNRKITRQQIEEMASNYDPDNRYGARIWLEHFRSLFPDGAFPALGDVLALKVQEEKDGKVGLYAKLSPTDQLLNMNQKRQKVYTSIEMDPSFADTGEAYFVGLAVTDSPASQGTQMLAFSQQNDQFTTDKYFSEFMEADLVFVDETKEEKVSLTERIKGMFSKAGRDNNQRFSDVDQAVTEIASEVVALGKRVENTVTTKELEDLQQEFQAFREKIENEEKSDNYNRQKATGVDGSRKKAIF